jgi:hypothetical protein
MMAKPSWPEETKQEVKHLRARGLLLREISEQLGVPNSTIRHWLSEAQENTSNKWSQDVIQRCIALREQGHAYGQIYAVTGVPGSTQRRWYPGHLRALKGTSAPKAPLVVTQPPKMIRKNGLDYKVGRHGKLFYLSDGGEWKRSNLSPAEVGL